VITVFDKRHHYYTFCYSSLGLLQLSCELLQDEDRVVTHFMTTTTYVSV